MVNTKKTPQIVSFNFPEGLLIQNKFKIIKKLGGGWESEVYRVVEIMTGIERAAKFFFPKRNLKNKTAIFHAKKLHKLRNCHILIQYLTGDVTYFQDTPITYLVSHYVEGIPLDEFLERQKGKRISHFQALHLLHTLAKGLEEIHNLKEYHGDLHSGNVIVQRHGLGFDLKILDFYHWGRPGNDNYQSDLINLVKLFHESIGGNKHYAKMPDPVKNIVCGLKSSLILKKFKTVHRLRTHIENMEWNSY